MEDRIETEELRFGERRTAKQVVPLHQVMTTQIAPDQAMVAVTGVESGQCLVHATVDPVVIEYLREVDHLQFVISLSTRPAVPEAERLPMLAGPGSNARQCWLCEGFGGFDLGDGHWSECVPCQGTGLVAKVVPEE